MTTVFLCLNKTPTFSAPKKIKIFGKYCILKSGPHGLGGGCIFVTTFFFVAVSQRFVRFSSKYMTI